MRYPLLGPASVIDCPVHRYTVAVGADGRVGSCCPGCQREARKALARWRQRRYRASRAPRGVAA